MKLKPSPVSSEGSNRTKATEHSHAVTIAALGSDRKGSSTVCGSD